MEIGGDGAGWCLASVALHQHHRRRPVAVAVQQRADDAAVQDVVERRVMRLRRPVADELVPLANAADTQPFVVRRPAPEAAVLRSPRFLDAFFGHRGIVPERWRHTRRPSFAVPSPLEKTPGIAAPAPRACRHPLENAPTARAADAVTAGARFPPAPGESPRSSDTTPAIPRRASAGRRRAGCPAIGRHADRWWRRRE